MTLDGSGSSDPDAGDTLSYAWSQTSGTTVTLSSTSVAQPSFTAPVLGANDPAAVLEFSLVVTDDKGNSSAADSVIITVNPPANSAPTADAGPDQPTVVSGATVTLDGSGSSDPDAGDTLSYAWSQTSGTTVTLSSTSVAQPSFTAPVLGANDPAAVLEFSLVVTDDKGNSSAADSVIITVNPPGFNAVAVQNEFKEITTSFVDRRMERILANEPLGYRLDRRRLAGSGNKLRLSAKGEVRQQFTFSSVSSEKAWYVWSEGSYSLYEDKFFSMQTREGEFLMLSFGADYLVNDNLAVGLMAQFDSAVEEVPGYSKVSGKGWLAGPYFSAEIRPNLFISARTAWGKSDNSSSIDVLKTSRPFEGVFKTDRFLSSALLYGKHSVGAVELTPTIEFLHIVEEISEFSVTDGVYSTSITGGHQELTRFSLSSDIEYGYFSNGLDLTLFATPQLDFIRRSNLLIGNSETTSGSFELGWRAKSSDKMAGEVAVRFDGLGNSDFSAVTIRSLFEWRF